MDRIRAHRPYSSPRWGGQSSIPTLQLDATFYRLDNLVVWSHIPKDGLSMIKHVLLPVVLKPTHFVDDNALVVVLRDNNVDVLKGLQVGTLELTIQHNRLFLFQSQCPEFASGMFSNACLSSLPQYTSLHYKRQDNFSHNVTTESVAQQVSRSTQRHQYRSSFLDRQRPLFIESRIEKPSLQCP